MICPIITYRTNEIKIECFGKSCALYNNKRKECSLVNEDGFITLMTDIVEELRVMNMNLEIIGTNIWGK